MKVRTETGKIIECDEYQLFEKGDDTYVCINEWIDDCFMRCMSEKVVAVEDIKDIFYAVDVYDDKIGICCYTNSEMNKNESFFRDESVYLKSKNHFKSFDDAYNYLISTLKVKLALDFDEEKDIIYYLNMLEPSSKRILVKRYFFNYPITRIAQEECLSRFKVEQKIEEIAHNLQLQFLKDEKGFTANTSTWDLPLTIDIYRKLKRMGITTLGQLIDTPYEDLYRQKNLGEKSLKLIRERINEVMKYSLDRKLILRKFMKDNYFDKEEIFKLLGDEE